MKTGQEFHFFVPGSITKSVDAAGDEDWIFEGIASTSNLDLFGDVVYPESFEKSLEFFRENGKIYYNHNYAKKMADEMMEAQTPIGIPLDARIVPEGLYIKAVLNKQHKLAQKIWSETMTNPDDRFSKGIGLSIGAKALGPTKREYSSVHKKYVNILPDLLLYEVSMTPTPVNPETRTWINKNSFESVVKSLVGEDNAPETPGTEYVQVTPQEVIVDHENNLMVVKSSIRNDDDTTYVFEQTFPIPEDILKAMPEDTNKKPAPSPEEKTPTEGQAPQEGGGEESKAPPAEGQEGGGNPFAGGDDAGAAPEGQEGAAPDAEGAPGAEGGMPGEEGAPGEGMPGAEGGAEGAGSPLDSLFGGGAEGGPDGAAPDAQNPEGMADAQPDASTSLILDKLDTLVDVMTTLVQDFASQKQSETGGVDSMSTPPVDTSSTEDVLKSLDAVKLELSNITRDNLSTILKSVLEEVLPGMITEVVVREISEKGLDTLKSAQVTERVVKVMQPGVELASVIHENGEKTVLKSFSQQDLDTTVLKGLITDYTSIRGANHSASSKRSKVLLQAEESLGLPSAEFYFYVRQFEKGELKI